MKKVALLSVLIGVIIVMQMSTVVLAFNPQPEPPVSEFSDPHTVDQFDTLFPTLDVGPEPAQAGRLTHDAIGSDAQDNPMHAYMAKCPKC